MTKKDILAYIESGAAAAGSAAAPRRPPRPPRQPAAPAPPAAAQPAPAEAGTACSRRRAAAAGEVAEPMTAMRRGVMEHMRRSLDTSAHVTSAIEVDMSKIVAARERLKKEYQSSYGVNPTYLAFIAHATVETLRDYPWVNAEIRGESIVTRPWVNLGIAVALEDGKGLIVPVIKNAQDLNLLGMARRSPTSRPAPARRSCCRTTSRAAPSRSRIRAASAPSTGRRSSASPRSGSSAPTRS